jgi:hypothetical protein
MKPHVADTTALLHGELEEQVYGPPQPNRPEGRWGAPNGASREDLLALIRELEEELDG